MFYKYRWTGVDLTTGEIFLSSKNYHTLYSVRESIAKYLLGRDPDDYTFDIIRIDNRGYKTPVYYGSKTDLEEGSNLFTHYYWDGLDLVTGEIFGSLRRSYDSLESVERSIESYITKYLSDRDPEDYAFEVVKIDDRGHRSLLYTKTKRDLGERVSLRDWYHFLNLSEETAIPDMDAEAKDMRAREADTLFKKIKGDDIIGDAGVEGLDPLQKLKLANVMHKIKIGKSKNRML